jgi:hypothetical protein
MKTVWKNREKACDWSNQALSKIGFLRQSIWSAGALE